MRYPTSEKLLIIRPVEGSHLSAHLTLANLSIPCTTFYHWYDRYLQRGEAGIQDQSPMPKHIWNRLLREHDKQARICTDEGLDHVRYLARLTELERFCR